MTLLLFVLVSSFIHHAASAAIGIDLGTEFLKIGLATQGKTFQIVENSASKRKTATAISFQRRERAFEDTAVGKKSRFGADTFLYPQRFLGLLANDTAATELLSALYDEARVVADPERGTIAFELNEFTFADEEAKANVTAEEVVAMILRHAKVLAERQLRAAVTDCVVTIPTFFSQSARRALLDAADLAGLNPLGLVPANVAAATHYGSNRLDKKPHVVLFVNLGAMSLELSLVRFVAAEQKIKDKKSVVETITVLAEHNNDKVGGYFLDVCLAELLADRFDALPSRRGTTSIRQTPRSMQRLIREAKKAKEILSSNKATNAHIESLADGVDLDTTVERSDFETHCAAQFDALPAAIDALFEGTGLGVGDIDEVEVLGGGIRVPKVQEVLSARLKRELGAHLNGDEAMALGAAFIAANLSTSLKVKPIALNYGLPAPVRLVLRSVEPNDTTNVTFLRNTTLFPARSKYPGRATVSFVHNRDLDAFFLVREAASSPERAVAVVGLENITGFEELPAFKRAAGPPKVTLGVGLNQWGLVFLESVQALVEELPAEDEGKKKGKPAKLKLDVFVNSALVGPRPLSQAQMKASTSRIQHFDDNEALLRRIGEARNRLESALYSAKEHLENEEYARATTEEERAELAAIVKRDEQWLEDTEGNYVGLKQVQDRLDELKKALQKGIYRLEEEKNRPGAIEEARRGLTDLEKKISRVNENKPWIGEDLISAALRKLSEAKEWLDHKVAEQAVRKIYEDFAFTVSDVKQRLQDLRQVFNHLANTPKPRKTTIKTEEKTEEKPAATKPSDSDEHIEL
eukprot:TRINITY_DN10980_c0_g1_i1.p1 TRINITY_DN10980_c0_g1~~TRINITY_DN10980_c0_g1_i1.p1  ORF type:complete len:808 (-),score=233.68 TRINITY_DN10980_c0_g1_i1:102-2525(-)